MEKTVKRHTVKTYRFCNALLPMAALPHYRPRQLSLGSLEREILSILWQFGSATVKSIHEQILRDPDRELTAPSITTVLNRLEKKGWVKSDRGDRPYRWQCQLSEREAQMLMAHDQLQQFLANSNPDVIAAFADSLDQSSVEQLEAIAQRIREARQRREEG